MKKLLNKKGFTIVELVIVIAVIAILAAVLIPTFSNVIESANKSADLSEAQNSLKAYSAYTSSKGHSLADGTVFKVKKSNRAYVFYKGSLHEFKEREIVGDYVSILAIGETSYISNKMTAHYLNDAGNDVEFDVTTVDGNKKQVVFFYSDTKNVTFEDGSLNCEIYPGRLVYFPEKYYTLENGKYEKSATTITKPDNTEVKANIAYVTIDKVISKVIKVTRTGSGESIRVDAVEFINGDEKAITSLPELAAGQSYSINTDGVKINDRIISIEATYELGTNIDITITSTSASE